MTKSDFGTEVTAWRYEELLSQKPDKKWNLVGRTGFASLDSTSNI